jgi:hypothetical protein
MKLAKMFVKKQDQHAGVEESEGGFGNYTDLDQETMKKY